MRLATTIALLLIAATAFAKQLDVPVAWTAPTTGSPVVLYVLQLSMDDGDWLDCCTSPTPAAAVQLETGHAYRARVAGRDALNRMGPWSQPSASYYADAGLPGPCGVVIFPGNE